MSKEPIADETIETPIQETAQETTPEEPAKMIVNGHSVFVTPLEGGRFRIQPDSFSGPTIEVDSEEDIARNVPTTVRESTQAE